MIKAVYYNAVHQILKRLGGRSFCAVYNLVQIVGHRSRRCRLVDDLLYLSDVREHIYFARPTRYRYYSQGIHFRLRNLFEQYCGSIVALRKGDVIIDCGANIGEFSLFCQKNGAVCVAFEPDPLEFRALEKNLGSSDFLHKTALWKENATLTFNLANDTGDSSVDAGFMNGDKVLVQACRLDSIAHLRSLSTIRLFKLEAEGFEMEALMGAEDILDRIEFIAADLGPERGPERESPLPVVTNFLVSRGFRLCFFNPSRSILLFRNERLTSTTDGGITL